MSRHGATLVLDHLKVSGEELKMPNFYRCNPRYAPLVCKTVEVKNDSNSALLKLWGTSPPPPEWLDNPTVGHPLHFYGDNAHPHRKGQVDEYFETENIQRMKVPARYPDLNPTERF
ncbi:hypothetical protein TNCV_3093781 [Trichonephila clavipes]|nr:hypothetical protein TNCV_3093781 [Trichonephila clavipes]